MDEKSPKQKSSEVYISVCWYMNRTTLKRMVCYSKLVIVGLHLKVVQISDGAKRQPTEYLIYSVQKMSCKSHRQISQQSIEMLSSR